MQPTERTTAGFDASGARGDAPERSDASAAGAGAAEVAGRRLTASRILVVVGTVLALLATMAIWVSRQALETDEWTRTSSALLQRPAVQTAVAEYLVDQVYVDVDVAGELRAALPQRADPLAAPVANALRGGAEQVARRTLDRPRVQAAWERANRQAHTLLVDAVLDRRVGAVSTERGEVTLDLRALVAALAQRLGVGQRLVDKLPPTAARIEILRSEQLGMAQTFARAIKPLTLVLLLSVFACFGAAIGLARGRRREIVRDVGLGLVFAGATALVVRKLAGTALVDQLGSTAAVRPAIEDTWRVGTSLLVDTSTAVIAYGALIVAGAWVAGTSRVGVALRRELAPYLRSMGLTYGAFAAMTLLVLAWGPTGATRRVVPVLVLIALAAAAVEALRRQVRAEFPDATRRAGAARTRALLNRARELWGPRRSTPGHDAEQPSVPATIGTVAQLEHLDALHRSGGLDDEEFRAAKRRVLSDSS